VGYKKMKNQHGLSRTKIYTAWLNMKARCDNSKSKDYKNYGGRGITYQDSWKDFNNFYQDYKDVDIRNLTLDRENVNEGYSIENCRWVSRYEQAINKTNNFFIDFNNQSLTLTDWAKKLNKKRSTLAQRYYVYKWDVEKVLTN